MPEVISLDGPDASILADIKTMKQDIKDLQNRSLFTGTNLSFDATGHLNVSGLQLHPSQAATAYTNSTGTLGVNTTLTTIASCSITVPTGYTTAIVIALGFGEGRCSVAGGDFFYVNTIVTSTGGGIASTGFTTSALTSGAVPSQSSTGTIYGFTQYPQAWANLTDVFTGISGGVMRADLQIASQVSSWTADPFTNGTISLQAIFLA